MNIFPKKWRGRLIPLNKIPEFYIKEGEIYETKTNKPMGRKQLNHVQYKRNIHPDFVDKMDKHLNKLKKNEPIKDVRMYAKEQSEKDLEVLKKNT